MRMEIKFDSEVASSYSEKHKANIESQIEELQEKLKICNWILY